MSQSDALKQAEHTEEKPAGRNQVVVVGAVVCLIIVLIASIVRSLSSSGTAAPSVAVDSTQPTQTQQRTNVGDGQLRSFLGAIQEEPVERNNVIEPAGTNPFNIIPGSLTPPVAASPEEGQYILQALQGDINGNVTVQPLDSGSLELGDIVAPTTVSTASDVSVRAAELRATISRLEEVNRRAVSPGYTEEVAMSDLAYLSDNGFPAPVAPNSADRSSGKLLPPGMLIQSVLVNELNSDVSSSFVAMVKYPVYDSARENILIPTGSRLYGSINSGERITNAIIQQRVTLQVRGVVLPNDTMIDLGSTAGLDVSGAGGVQGDTASHFWTRTLGTFGYAILSVGPGLTVSNGEAQSSVDEATGEVVEQVSSSFVPLAQQYASIVPTKIIPAGTLVNVVVEVPVYVEPYQAVTAVVDFGGIY